MTRDGESEPALVGPWTMGRDKKNPKTLDGPAFSTLVKTATARLKVTLDITPAEDNRSALLRAFDELDAALAQVSAAPNFIFTGSQRGRWPPEF